MTVSLFEDETFENFLPQTYTKPVFKPKSGIFVCARGAIETQKRVFALRDLKQTTEDIELLKTSLNSRPKKGKSC